MATGKALSGKEMCQLLEQHGWHCFESTIAITSTVVPAAWFVFLFLFMETKR
ncbi:MAG TPA: hypothetical protein VFA60_02960 [Terriglobales bacterium]|nr:hypothetical protein [Terriglobales bacterium]